MIAHIEEAAVHTMPAEQQRWYAIKIFERDEKVLEQLKAGSFGIVPYRTGYAAAERTDDDAESIITNERRYVYISSIIKGCYKKRMRASCLLPIRLIKS